MSGFFGRPVSYRFERFGTLWWYEMPMVRIGKHLISAFGFVWWWPVNWLAVPVALLLVARDEIRKELKK